MIAVSHDTKLFSQKTIVSKIKVNNYRYAVVTATVIRWKTCLYYKMFRRYNVSTLVLDSKVSGFMTKVLIPDSCFVFKWQNESGTKTFQICHESGNIYSGVNVVWGSRKWPTWSRVMNEPITFIHKIRRLV